MAPCRIILVRHGETAWNHAGRYLGQADPGLNDKGKTQARAVADLLKQENIDAIFSSDLLRAVETSRIIADINNVPVKLVPGLREIDFGEWEGLTFKQIQSSSPACLSAWLNDPFKTRIPGGETAEELWYRVIQAWNYIVQNSGGADSIVVVAHGGSLRLLWCQLSGIDPLRQWEFCISHGEAVVLKRTSETYSIIQPAK